jgi:hypothetical protein
LIRGAGVGTGCGTIRGAGVGAGCGIIRGAGVGAGFTFGTGVGLIGCVGAGFTFGAGVGLTLGAGVGLIGCVGLTFGTGVGLTFGEGVGLIGCVGVGLTFGAGVGLAGCVGNGLFSFGDGRTNPGFESPFGVVTICGANGTPVFAGADAVVVVFAGASRNVRVSGPRKFGVPWLSAAASILCRAAACCCVCCACARCVCRLVAVVGVSFTCLISLSGAVAIRGAPSVPAVRCA